MYSRSHWKCTSALATLLSLAGTGGYAASLPSGGHYVSGKGEIGRAGQSLTVKQSSTTGIIDWNKFSVGAKNNVTFDNGAGATLNRVTGGNLSTIAGHLHATGSLYLLNSSGVVISGTGRVLTGGNFVAMSGNIGSPFDTDSRFKAVAGKVVNEGTIIAGGGATLAGGGVHDSGTIRAARVNLQAQQKLSVDGDITARNAEGSGGTIIATARHIAVGSDADISASGAKGGTVLIGGDIHGGAIAGDNFVSGAVKNAQRTIIGAGARIDADGSKSTGGNIVIWSDGHTSFSGQIDAKGKTAGGFAEVSSHDLLGFTGKVDLTSTHGTTGNLLLDPEDVTIEGGTTANGTLAGGTFKPSGDDSVLSVSDLEAALATANVTVTTGSKNSTGTQSGDITVADGVSWSSSNTLTLDAYGAINVNASLSGADLKLSTTTGGITISQAISMSGNVALDSGAAILEKTTGGIDTQVLSGKSTGGAKLIDGGNMIAQLGNFTAIGGFGGGLSLTDGETLTVTGIVRASEGNVSLKTLGSGHNIEIDNKVDADSKDNDHEMVTLNSAGMVSENGAGLIDTQLLAGDSMGGATLGTANLISGIYHFSNKAGGGFALTDAQSLAVIGNLGAGNGDIALTVTGSSKNELNLADGEISTARAAILISSGEIVQGRSSIKASTLRGSAGRSAMLTGSNLVNKLGKLSFSGQFSFNNEKTVDIAAPINAGDANVSLSTTGQGSDLVIDSALKTGGTVSLESGGTINENAGATINAAALSVLGNGDADLNGANKISSLINVGLNDGGSLSLTDAKGLVVASRSSILATGNISLTTMGSGHGIAIDALIFEAGKKGVITLHSAAQITSSTDAFTAYRLKGSSVGGATLGGGDAAFSILEGFVNTGGGNITIARVGSVTGKVSNSGGNINLNGNLSISALIEASGNVTLSGKDVRELTGGSITANSLTASANDDVVLESAANAFAILEDSSADNLFEVSDREAMTVAGSVTDGGDFKLIDSHSLSIEGAIDAGTHNIDLTTKSGDIAIDGELDAGTVNLTSAGTANESGTGAIVANLLNVTAQTGILLTSKSNMITAIGTDETTSGPNKITLK